MGPRRTATAPPGFVSDPPAGREKALSTEAFIDRSVLDDLQALILLAGKVAPTPLSTGVRRSLLDLPIEPGRTLLDLWCEQATALASSLGRERLTVRVVLDRAGSEPRASAAAAARLDLSVERDPYEFRGTAGVVKDVTSPYSEGKWVLVGSASQLQLEPLESLVGDLASDPGAFNMVTHTDGTPVGLMLIRCGSLDEIPDVGFVDMKEQALPSISERHTVKLVRRDQRTALPIRTLADYILALRVYHLRGQGQEAVSDPFAERWQKAFALVEEGGDVAASATLQDSVVLAGGVVGPDAVVVRSVVCPGGVVRRRASVIDEIVTGAGA